MRGGSSTSAAPSTKVNNPFGSGTTLKSSEKEFNPTPLNRNTSASTCKSRRPAKLTVDACSPAESSIGGAYTRFGVFTSRRVEAISEPPHERRVVSQYFA